MRTTTLGMASTGSIYTTPSEAYSLLSAGPLKADESLYVVCNFTPVVRPAYRLGVSDPGDYTEALNSDDARFGGSGVVNAEPLASSPTPWHDQPYSVEITLPPLAVVFIKSLD